MADQNQEEHNETRVTEFILLGFPGSPHVQMLMFMVFLIMYILTVLGNASIIVLVTTNRRLHSPMYFFLCNLSFLEVWYTTASVPKILAIFLGRSRSISFAGCLLQMYFILSFGCTEHILLAVMAYDRYLAICYPLHYHTIMDMSLFGKLAGGAWLGGFLVVIFPSYLITRLSFCGSNMINNFFCNIDNWVVLSCTNTSFLEMTVFVTAIFVIIGSCVVTLLSYIFIISTIVRIPSTEGRKKAFSTCSSHFAVVIIWYGSTVFLFVKPSKQTALEVNKIVSIFNLIVVPVMNPFIYTLRNKEVRDVLRNKFHRV